MYRQSIQFPAKDAGLRDDVHALGALIGETLRDQGGEEFFTLVEGDRLAAIRRREGDAAGAAELQSRTMDRAATDLTRAFAIWFQAVNTAEKVHRVRRRRQYLSDSSTSQPGGIADCIARLQRAGLTLQQVLALIGSMSIEPVFTGHPTESTRRTILRKQQHIAQDMLERHIPGSTAAERSRVANCNRHNSGRYVCSERNSVSNATSPVSRMCSQSSSNRVWSVISRCGILCVF